MKSVLNVFSHEEKRNLLFYISGIMCYKLALESLTGSFADLILNSKGFNTKKSSRATLWTIALSSNYALQCFGSLIVTPLIRRCSIQRVLSVSILLLGLLVSLIPLLELIDGGKAHSGYSSRLNTHIFVISFIFIGILQGIVELIRRVVPQNIVGLDAIKLKKMDSMVHIFYEIAGTSGAFLSYFTLKHGNAAYALTVIPVFFTVSSILWSQIQFQGAQRSAGSVTWSVSGLFKEITGLFRAFFHSVKLGFRLVFTRRDLIWLVPAYSLPLVLHRYLENVLFIQYGRDTLGHKEFSQILLVGSNFGELLGALFILVFSNLVETPLPWLRLDALTLFIVWIFPYGTPFGNGNAVAWAWLLAVIMCGISFGWASGDVSLVAFVQSNLGTMDDDEHNMASPLGSVMAFLYVIYILLFAILSPTLGYVYDAYVDRYDAGKWRPEIAKQSQSALVWTGGVFFSVCAVIIFFSTFIPKHSFTWNPKLRTPHQNDASMVQVEISKLASVKGGSISEVSILSN